MDETLAERSYELVWLIRRLFRSMAREADRYLEAIGISVADRAVMEFLYPDKQLSVPEIASRYDVSRQHVQVTANRLLDRGLMNSMPNPRHKRSVLMRLSDTGRAVFAGIRHNEDELLERLFVDVDRQDLEATRQTLRTMLDKLNQE
ncbi:MAG: MarR family transcriptional regulator [Woeseiaceae bacterium]|nr:MarR family transcriptional regulator [Woeseiaceae bacterium]